MHTCNSVPELLTELENGEKNPKALGYLDGEEWKYISSEEMLLHIRKAAYSLTAMGYKKGDFIGIMGTPSPWWTIMDLAIMCLGCVSVPLFPNISEENFVFETSQTGLHTIFVGGVISWELIRGSKYLFKQIVDMDGTSVIPGTLSLHEFLGLGEKLSEEEPDLFMRLRNTVKPQDLATVVYTSGSTGIPKGAMLTQEAIIASINLKEFQWNVNGTDIYLSILPLAHIFGRVLNFSSVSHVATVCYLQDPKLFGKACKELHPTFLVVVPRLLEKIYSKMLSSVQNSGFMMRAIGRWAFDLANTNEDHLYKNLMHPIADKVVYSVMRDSVGGRVRILISGGSALNPDLNKFFQEIGFPVLQGWGLTEACPLTLNIPEHNKIGTCGRPILGIELKIGEKNEILVKGVVKMLGYYKNPEATERAIDSEGWLHTGDAGNIDSEGYLTIVGRLKEMFKTSTGEYIVPVPIEQSIGKALLIDAAVVIAEGRKYATCLLFPDFEVLARLKQDHQMTNISDQDFLQSDIVRSEMSNLFDSINKHLNRWEKVLDYRFVLHHLTIEGGELTPSMKVRRDVLEKKFAEIINTMYIADVAPVI